MNASARRRTASLVVVLAVAGLLAAPWAMAQRTPAPAIEDEPAGRALLEAYAAILREYQGSVDRQALLEGALRGLVAALDDPYVRYLDPDELAVDAQRRRDPGVVVAGSVGDLGYLRVTSFDSERAGERVAAELDALLGRGVRGVVLDLRGNGGGLVLPGLQVLDRFLADVVLGYRSGPQGAVPLGFANPSATALPLVVVVDEGTASTAEIVAGALQAYGRARLVGRVTAGKGVGQTAVPLADGGELRLVTFAWTLPDGRSIDGWGLTPDVPVRGRAAVVDVAALVDVVADPALDPALAAAVRSLRGLLGDDLVVDGGTPGEPTLPPPLVEPPPAPAAPPDEAPAPAPPPVDAAP